MPRIVAHPHEDRVGHAAEEARQAADAGAHDAADEDHAQGDEKGAPRPLHDPGEKVPAQVVRPQQVGGAGGEELVPGHGRGGIGGPEPAHRHQGGYEGGDDPAGDEKAVGLLPADGLSRLVRTHGAEHEQHGLDLLSRGGAD